ncbi:MAG: DnaJ domain-containing protein [Thermoflexibacter sp.]|nr:DnaJ domain-containing protein [Thermoflexibacter sp.]
MENYYAILGLPNYSSEEEIKRAFKKMALLYHPDRNPNDSGAEEKFKLINQAYQVLSNSDKKRKYDEILLHGNYGYTFKFNHTEQRQQEAPQRHYTPPTTVYQTWRKERGKQEKQAIIFSISAVVYFFIIVSSFFQFYSRIQYLEALDAYENKKYEEALYHLRACTGADPSYGRAYYLKGLIYLERMDYNGEAVSNFSMAIKHTYQSPLDYYYRRALAYTNLREENLAEKDFERVLKAKPYYDSIITRTLADAYYERFQNYDKAIQMYDKFLTKYNPNYERAFYNLGFIYKSKEEYKEAINQFSKFLSFQNDNAEIYYERSLCYLYDQQLDRSCMDWKTVKVINPSFEDPSLDFFCAKRDSIFATQ